MALKELVAIEDRPSSLLIAENRLRVLTAFETNELAFRVGPERPRPAHAMADRGARVERPGASQNRDIDPSDPSGLGALGMNSS
jgi:hypothetical protein